MTTDGIDPKLLRLANALSFMAYTGFVLALPPALAGRYWATGGGSPASPSRCSPAPSTHGPTKPPTPPNWSRK
jgi:hypothetical protein